MTSEERALFLAACRYAIAICRQEVEKAVPGVIELRDDGSPWGRAFIRCCEESKEDDV